MAAPNFRFADIKHCGNCIFRRWRDDDEMPVCIKYRYATDGMICDDYDAEVNCDQDQSKRP